MNIDSIDTKVIGYGLLVSGLIIIAIAAFNILSIYKGDTRAFSYFNFEPISISTEFLLPEAPIGTDFPVIEIASEELLNDSTNLLAHLFILGVVINIGSRISQIGVSLLRPIKINNATIQTK